jgi:spore coat protein U-like protein
MKLMTRLDTTKVVLFATLLLATCFSASSANAQSTFSGKFTLQHETRWADAVLPPGEYVIALDRINSNGPVIVRIRNAASGKPVAMVLSANVDTGTEGISALLTAFQGHHWVVYSLQVAKLGQVFVYDRALANGQATEEVGKTQVVPVTVAKE